MKIALLSSQIVSTTIFFASNFVAAQSANPFGIPTEESPTPAANVVAAAGSRAQGWLGQGRSEVIARHGIVATSDTLAAQAGLEILQAGGNAVDAAVAAGAVLDVTSQNDTGIAGDLFALVYVAQENKLYALNSAGWAPAGWTPEFLKMILALILFLVPVLMRQPYQERFQATMHSSLDLAHWVSKKLLSELHESPKRVGVRANDGTEI